jgi:hypothetical protein
MPNKLAASRMASWFEMYHINNNFNPVLIGTLSRVHLPHILPFYYPCKLKEMIYFRFMSCLWNVSYVVSRLKHVLFNLRF